MSPAEPPGVVAHVVEWSLRHRAIVILLTVALAISGVLSLSTLPLDAFPDSTPKQVQLNTVVEQLTPEEMEVLVTIPLEQALAGTPGVDDLRSLSKFGLSQLTIRFTDDTDIWFARQQIAERVGRARLPVGALPTLGPVATGLGEVFHYLVKGDGRAEVSLETLRTVHDRVIAPRLRTVAGVAEVNAWGGDERQWHVVVEPLRLQQFGLSLGDVYAAIERNNGNVGGGVVERGGAGSLVLGVGALRDGAQLRDVVIAARDGVPIRVVDVARVEVGREIRRGAVTADGEGEVVLGLGFMGIGENSHAVTTALQARLAELVPTLPPGVEVSVVLARTTLVDTVLQTVRRSLIEGALLVVAVLFVFLGRLRAGLIVALAIPLSMLFAFNGMARLGIAGTLMSLGAIDFGLVVDSAVIMVENAERRLQEDGGRRPIADVVREAALEVRGPTLFGELIIMVVYLPILALEGIEGKMFRPMAVTVILALIGSMIFSVTLMPVLASLVLGRRRTASHPTDGTDGANVNVDVTDKHDDRPPLLVRVALILYRPVLQRALRVPRVVLGGAVIVIGGGGLVASQLGSEFIPRLSEGSIVINTVRLAEVSLEESTRYGSQVEQVLLGAFPDEVERIWTRTGTAEVATDPMGAEVSDVFVVLTDRARWRRAETREGLVEAMQRELADMPGMRFSFSQPIELRMNEMVAGARGDLAIKLFGDDLDVLKARARVIEGLVRKVPGAADVSVEQVTGQGVLRIEVDRAAIARHGIDAATVLDVIAAMGTRHVGDLREGERLVPIAVTLPPRFQHDPRALDDVVIAAPGGERVPLRRLVTVKETTGPTSIQREWGRRRVVVEANVRGRDLGGFVEDVKAATATVRLPPGDFITFGGQYEHLARARQRLTVVVPIALALVFGLLWLTYRRVVDAARVFCGVPFAMAGGVFALALRDLPLSISAAVGFIALSGVAVLGDMVLVSRIRGLADDRSTSVSSMDVVIDAATSRLRPVLMTSTVAILGFLPMALHTGVGAEVQRPLATVVIGGMFSSTLLTLIVLPVLYTAVSRRKP